MTETDRHPALGVLSRVARALWPGLADQGLALWAEGLASVWTAIFAGPLALVALAWLAAATAGGSPWPGRFPLWLVVALLLARLALARVTLAFAPQRWDSPARGLLARLPVWSVALVYGPALLWLDAAGALVDAWLWRRSRPGMVRRRWRLAADAAWLLARDTLPALAALSLYPPGQPSLFSASQALYATLARSGLSAALLLPLFALLAAASGRPMVSLTGLMLRLRAAAGWLKAVLVLLLADLLAVGAAVLLDVAAPWPYGLLLAGLVLGGRFLHAAEARAERAQEGRRLQAGLQGLGRDLLAAPDEEAMPGILAQWAPLLFPEGELTVKLFPEAVLFHRPADGAQERTASVHAPITSTNDGLSLGSVDWLPGPDAAFRSESFADAFAALRQMAACVAAALSRHAAEDEARAAVAEAYQSELYAELVKAEINQAYRQVSQELALAGQIQASFLPSELPELPGWQMAAGLEPARQTSGDFYDVVELPNGLLGLLVADVADKGIGPALYAALSRTLIRTYALEYGPAPARVLQAANRRILADTRNDLFVTVFYAVLDPASGELAYCNAGHNPPYHWAAGQRSATALKGTGMPLGLFEDAAWDEGRILLGAGDLLLMYTDGLVEAQDEEGDFFGEEALQAAAAVALGRPVPLVEAKILAAVSAFTGDAPQFDDMTWMLLGRER